MLGRKPGDAVNFTYNARLAPETERSERMKKLGILVLLLSVVDLSEMQPGEGAAGIDL